LKINCLLGVSDEGGDIYKKNLTNCSKLNRLIKIYENVLTFINNIKIKWKLKNPSPFAENRTEICPNIHDKALKHIIKLDQHIQYSEVIEYFNGNSNKSNMPNIVGQLNVYVDGEGLLRVRSKMERMKENIVSRSPLLL